MKKMLCMHVRMLSLPLVIFENNIYRQKYLLLPYLVTKTTFQVYMFETILYDPCMVFRW